MNCIILLLLLSCCGWGGNTGCGCGCRRSGCCGDARPRREEKPERRECGRQPRPDREDEGCGCGGSRKENEHCDMPGMIPPPWQEYPGFPRRDEGCGCDSRD